MAESEAVISGRKYAAELIGTFALVFFGCGAAVIAGAHIGFVGIAFAFGITVLMMVYAIGPISGCHINPAITIAMLAAKKVNVKDAAGYIVAQCIGAIIGAGLLWGIAMNMPGYTLAANGLGQNGWGPDYPSDHYPLMGALVAEVVFTFFFLLVIFGATSDAAPKGFAGIAIGLCLFVIHIVGIPITGVSVNPARSLGPALFVGGLALEQLWLFWVAPIVGGLFAAVAWIAVFEPRKEKPVKIMQAKMKEKKAKEEEEKEESEEEEETGEGDEEEKEED